MRQRSRGSWEIDWADPITKKRKYMTVKGNKKDAQRKLREILQALDEGTYTKPSKQTVAEFLSFWLSQSEGSYSESSLKRYGGIIRAHIIPALGNAPLSALTAMDIQAAYTDWQKKGLSPHSIRLHHSLLHRAFASAIRWGLLAVNPVAQAEPPRHGGFRQAATDEEVKKLCSAVKGTIHEPLVRLSLYTGMRIGEICALRWEDVDLEGRQVSVNWNAVRVAGKMALGPLKTDKSRRVVALPEEAVALLRELPRTTEYVFPGRVAGRPRSPAAVSDGIQRICKQAGVKVVMHQLRHVHASWLMQDGVNPKAVAERLGHSKVGITLQVYSHTIPSQDRDAAAKIGKRLADL